jgi:hypothetical protein
MNTYQIFALRFVPGYNDWDSDDVLIKADSESEALQKFNKLKWWTKGGVDIRLVENSN